MLKIIKDFKSLNTVADLRENKLTLSDYNELDYVLKLYLHMKYKATIKYGVLFLSQNVADWLKRYKNIQVKKSAFHSGMFEMQ